MDEWIKNEIASLEKQHGVVPPPWVVFYEHPYSICWRMGSGEAHCTVWQAWWPLQEYSEEQRIEYFRKWKPPHCWLEFVIDAIWDANPFGNGEEDFDYTPYFKRTEKLGFGSQADYEKDLDDPKWLEDD